MSLLPDSNEMPAAGTNGDGLDFVWTATPSEGQDDDHIHIRRNQA